jgi:hypothetical protein
MDEMSVMMRKKNELLKKIEEQKRMMELIKNPHIKDSLTPIYQFKKHKAVKTLQVI